jgi:hypothetical protein
MFDNDDRARRLFSRYSTDKLAKFKAWHLENPHVYSKFKELAYEMKKTGRSRYSAETIINVLRWHTDLTTTGSEFKISNDYRSMYARLLAYQDPDFERFFSFKGLDDGVTAGELL